MTGHNRPSEAAIALFTNVFGYAPDPGWRIDAALRRAKAEGMLAAAQLVEDDCYIEGGALLPDYEHRCKHNVNQKELAAKIRARAAQIEEGE